MGYALPGESIDTASLLTSVEERFGVKVQRLGRIVAGKLGVRSRYFCRDLQQRHESPRSGDTNAALAARAIEAALRDADVDVGELSYLIGHTSSPGQALPPNTAEVAERLGYAGPYMELRQACTGFANALVTARGVLSNPSCGPVAIVGSETGSVFFDPVRAAQDHGQLVNLLQMGDGAAACVLTVASDVGLGTLSHLYFGQEAAGRSPGFALSAGGSDRPTANTMSPEYSHDFAAVLAGGPRLFELGVAAALSMGVEADQVDYIIPHQVNGRIAEQLAPYLQLKRAQIFVNADRCGNTGSAAIWLALAQLRHKLRSGNRVLVLGAEATAYMYGGFLYVHR